jgi:hypothetical protein
MIFKIPSLADIGGRMQDAQSALRAWLFWAGVQNFLRQAVTVLLERLTIGVAYLLPVVRKQHSIVASFISQSGRRSFGSYYFLM